MLLEEGACRRTPVPWIGSFSKFWEIFKSTYFVEQLWMDVSESFNSMTFIENKSLVPGDSTLIGQGFEVSLIKN